MSRLLISIFRWKYGRLCGILSEENYKFQFDVQL